ncbi:MAG TPA: efflux transporter outer membrane subunit [Phycisphaerae bacterium]
MKRLWSGLLLAAGAAGCAVGPNYHAPAVATPERWSGIDARTPASQPAATTQPANVAMWWESLRDPMLDALVVRAVESNLDLRVAEARVREARALRDVATADFWPQINFGSSYTYSGASANVGARAASPPTLGGLPTVTLRPGIAGTTGQSTVAITAQRISRAGGRVAIQPGALNVPGGFSPPTVTLNPQGAAARISRQQNLFQMGFDATWELDIFGGIRRSVEAAEADLAAIEETRRDVFVTLLSEVALNYAELRGAQRRLTIARENIAAQRDTADLTRTRFQAGFTNELDVAQAEAQLATTQSQVPLLESAIRQAIYQLSVLLGLPPGDLVAELESHAPIPATSPSVPLGLPSDLLRRRPDIRAAERQLAAATARIGAAMADLFPKFSIAGSFGPAASDIRRLLDHRSLGWSIGPDINWPIFEGGRIRANIEVQNARQEQALATYEKVVLTAFQDVESALIAYTNEKTRLESLARAVRADQRALELSNELYSRGLTAFLNVLDSQRALYLAQDELVQSEQAAVVDLIALYKALGGGWELAEN